MNGKSKVSEVNSCERQMDIHTYGWRLANISFRGNRFFRLRLFGIVADCFWTGFCYAFPKYQRYKNAASIGGLLGSVTWPMPTKKQEIYA